MDRKLKMRSNIPYILMVLPALVLFITFFIVPLIFTGKYSFYNWTNYSPDSSLVGMKNYQAILGDGTIFVGIKNSMVYALATVILQSFIALPVAVLLNKKLRGKNVFRAVFFCPAVLSTLVVGYLWKYLLSASDYGFVNQVLSGIGLEKMNFLGDAKIALAMIILTQVWQWFGWSMVIYLGNLQSISDDLYEAASIDGAGALKQFWHIIIPGLAPAIKINLINGTIAGLKVFDIIISMTGGGPAHKTETILTLMFSRFSEGNYGYASAFGIIFLIVSMIVACILLGAFGRWERRLGQ